jgi:hypothetical protein
MSADTTIGAVEQSIGGLPHAIAGLEANIASIFHRAAGIGEDALSALGLKHALGVVQHIETGATTTLHQIGSTVENAAPEAEAVSQIAEALTPAQIAAQIIPHSGAVADQLDKAAAVVDAAAAGTIDPATVAVVHHNRSLIHLIHTGLQGVETAGDIAGKLPIVQNIGLWGLSIVSLNSFLHWLEPVVAKFDPAAAST